MNKVDTGFAIEFIINKYKCSGPEGLFSVKVIRNVFFSLKTISRFFVKSLPYEAIQTCIYSLIKIYLTQEDSAGVTESRTNHRFVP